ncbi:BppU family phage baseplate upper protein, partial [Enterococcus faecium]|nr:BppU family phage baseplate upper protein [Enterococcus faecium]
MNEDNKIFKTNEFSIEVSPVENTKQVKNVQYFSYDENSGLQLIHILMEGKPLDLPNGTEIRLSAVKLNNQNQKLIYTPEIVDPLKGIVSFVIPREFLGYQGQIRCGLYINFSNNQTMHVGYFYINMDVSDIDTNLTEFTEDFWQGWSEFEASSTAKMKELEQRIDEQTEIFNNADVYNKAEIEDKLEPFALRTDIDTLEIKKADKTNVEDLVTKKADKETLNTMISELNARISNIPKGNPSGTFATLADLKAKYPSGNGNVYVVSADNKWYYWSGSTWTAGGPYQPAELPDEGIGLPKFDAGVSKYRDGSSLTWT